MQGKCYCGQRRQVDPSHIRIHCRQTGFATLNFFQPVSRFPDLVFQSIGRRNYLFELLPGGAQLTCLQESIGLDEEGNALSGRRNIGAGGLRGGEIATPGNQTDQASQEGR